MLVTKLLIFTKILHGVMKKLAYILFAFAVIFLSCVPRSGHEEWVMPTADGLPVRVVDIDTMNLRNPFIYLDKENLTYYMSGDGGAVWVSNDLHKWKGPYDLLELDSTIWIGMFPQISSPEIHRYNNKFYFVATFTRPDVVIENVSGTDIPRRSCQLLVADSLQGPYKPIDAETPLLPAAQASLSATFCNDEYGAGYIIYSRDYRQTGDGTVQILRLDDNFGGRIGEPFVMFRASQNEWSKAKGGDYVYSPRMDGAFLFDTEGLELGMLFTTDIAGESAVGVAYTEKNCGFNGPWHIERQPFLTGNYGEPMLFKDFDGTLVMLLHKDTVINGRRIYKPTMFEMDSQYDKLKIKGKYNY